MKYSGVEWIGNIPDNWEIRKVKQCFYISKEQAHIENPTILSLARAGVKVRDVSNNEGQLAASYDNYNPVQPGDLLLNPMDLYSGANCSLSEVEGVISPAYVNLRKQVELNPKFYDYYFKTQYWAMAMFAHGKGVSFDNRWTMNAETVLNYYLPLPSFEEQNKIVEILNKKIKEIDSLIEIENQQIEKLKEYRQSFITKIISRGVENDIKIKNSGVDWISNINANYYVCPLKHLLNEPMMYGANESGEKVKGYYRYIRITDIDGDGNLKFTDDDQYLSEVSGKLYELKEGDVLFARSGGTVGKSFIYKDKYGKSAFAGYLIKASCNTDKLLPQYLYLYTQSSIYELWKDSIFIQSTIQNIGAKEEGFILDVLSTYVTIKEAFKLITNTEENPELLEEKAKRALFKYYKQHEFTIAQKVDMIMDNFLNNGRKKINGHGKAMIVTDSRQSAVLYYQAVKEYLEKHPTETSGCGVLVAFSGKVKFDGDDTEYIEAEMNEYPDGRKINSDAKFRKAFKSDDFNIMVVADKYQTGYDEPLLHSMFVDKKLKGVNAVQTLSRLNRTAPFKSDTFVLDFANTSESIKESFQPFYEETTLVGGSDVNRVYDLRSKLTEFAIFNDEDVDKFYTIMKANSNKKKQDDSAIGKLVSVMKPAVDNYADLDDDKRLLARDTMMKFIRSYGFVTQLVRINDEDLFKDYLYISHLIRLLPKTQYPVFDLTGKVSLEYAKLKETFKGAIELEKEGGEVVPGKGAKPAKKSNKTDTLERIVVKINEKYQDDFSPADKVALDSVFQMLMGDPVVKKKLTEYAKTNDAQMFIKSIFPKEFERVLVECYTKNDDAFQRLLGNDQFQKAVMDIMAKELYKTLVSEKEENK